MPAFFRNPFDPHRILPRERTEEPERPAISWPAYAFMRFKAARRAIYPERFSTVRVPGAPGKVSVILPVLNPTPGIAEAIAEILSQTHENLELIIVEDDSSDRPHALAVEHARNDCRVKHFRLRAQELSCALNHGLRRADGEFLTWITPDKHLPPDSLKKLVDYLQRHPEVDLAYADADIIEKNDRSLSAGSPPESVRCQSSRRCAWLPAEVAELNMVAGDRDATAFLYRNRMDYLLGDYSLNRSGAENHDYLMQMNALGTIHHVDFPDSFYERPHLATPLPNEAQQLEGGLARNSLMVFDDARRDFYLTPLAWIFDTATDQQAQMMTADMRAWIAEARHILLDSPSLTRRPDYRWWFPLAALRVSSDVKDAYAIPDWPEQAFKVFILAGKTALPSDVPDQWDLCISLQELPTPPPRLVKPRQGWLAVQQIEMLCAVIDIRVKQAQLAGLEAQILRPEAPQCRLSVVICTYHRGTLLKEALVSVARQTIPRETYEVLVVNNDPSDTMVHGLVEEVRKSEFSHRPEHLRDICCPFKGLSFARNAGISAARGGIVAFLDDDAIALPDWLEQIDRAALAFPEAGVIGGPILLTIPNPRPRWLREGWEHYWSHFEAPHQEARVVEEWGSYPWGANWCARRKALLEIGGFRTKYGRRGDDFAGGEEVVAASLARRLGYSIVLAPAARVVHNPDESRYSLRHLRKTIRSIVETTYQTQIDLYAPVIPSIEDIEKISKERLALALSLHPLSWHIRLEHWLFAWSYQKLKRRMRRDLYCRKKLTQSRLP